ncbi:MAG: hypothetical protein ACYCZF_15760 [Anaerolineae bacterium]
MPVRLVRYWRCPAHLAFWSVIGLALLLRIGHLDLIAFDQPAAQQLASSAALVNNPTLPLFGETGADGITQPALVTYLYALPLLLSRDPRLAVAWTVILNVCAIALCYSSLRRWFGLRTAVFTILLWAVNPWAILQARTIGPSAFAPVWCALLFYGLVQGLQETHSPGWLLAWLAAGLLVNTSINYWPAILFLSIVCALYWHRVHWPSLVAGAGLGLLLMIPYLYYQSYVNFRDILAILPPDPSVGVVTTRGWQALFGAMRFVSGLDLADLAGSTRVQYLMQRLPLSIIEGATAVVFLVSLPICLAWMIRALARWRERAQAARYIAIVLWMAVILLASASEPVRPGKVDLSLLSPFGFIVLGLALAALFTEVVEKINGSPILVLLARGVTAIALAAICLWPAYSILNLYSYADKTSMVNGYGLPLRFWLQTARFTRPRLAIAAEKTLYLTADSTDGLGVGSSAILGYLLDGSAHIIPLCPDSGRCLMIPIGHSNHILVLQPALETLDLIRQLAGKELAYTTLPDKAYSSHLYLLPAISVTETVALIPQRSLWSIDDGAFFLGYSPPGALPIGQTSYIATYWSFRNPDTSEVLVQHGMATRITDLNDTPSEVRTAFGLDERYWRMDKVLVRWLPVQLPEGGAGDAYRLQIAVFRVEGTIINRTFNENTSEPNLAIELAAVRVE